MAQQPATATDLRPPSLRTMVVGLLPSIIVNGVLVFVIYKLVKSFTSASDILALFLSAIPAMIGSIISIARQRRIDVLGAFALITIAVSIVLTFLGGDARLFQIRESFLTVLFGIVCLIRYSSQSRSGSTLSATSPPATILSRRRRSTQRGSSRRFAPTFAT